jgi:hypothetical protein
MLDKLEENNNISNWIKFKKWCYKYHRHLAISMMILLIIIGIWLNPFDKKILHKSDELLTEQTGGVAPVLLAAGRAGSALGKVPGKINSKMTGDSKAIKDIMESGVDQSKFKLNDLNNKQRLAAKSSAITSAGFKGTTEMLGKGSDYALGKFRDNASIIYEFIYQLAFVILILLVVFPTIALFIIGIICFILLRQKLNYVKAL